MAECHSLRRIFAILVKKIMLRHWQKANDICYWTIVTGQYFWQIVMGFARVPDPVAKRTMSLLNLSRNLYLQRVSSRIIAGSLAVSAGRTIKTIKTLT
jgi:hypothetical protein